MPASFTAVYIRKLCYLLPKESSFWPPIFEQTASLRQRSLCFVLKAWRFIISVVNKK